MSNDEMVRFLESIDSDRDRFFTGEMSIAEYHQKLCARIARSGAKVFSDKLHVESAQVSAPELTADQKLTAAIEAENIDTLSQLLQTTGPSGLHLSRAAGKSVDIVQLLVKHGAPIDEPDNDNVTPLGRAALGGKPEVVTFLCQRGASVNKKMRSDSTPLHAAALSGCPSVIKTLLDYGADATAKDHLGRTPLHRALEKGHLMAIGLLIGTGKALEEKDHAGLTPIDYANRYKPAAADVLREKLATLSLTTS